MKFFLFIVAVATVCYGCDQTVWVNDGPPSDSPGGESDPRETDSNTDPDSDEFVCLAGGTEGFVDPQINFVIAVDSSAGMEDEVDAVQSLLNGIFQRMEQYGMDARIVLLSADSNAKSGLCIDAPLGSGSCPDDGAGPAYTHIFEPVGSKDALRKITDTYDLWKDAIHPSAAVAFLVVTDDDSDLSAAEFRDRTAAFDPAVESFLFYAIASSANKDEACTVSEGEPCCLYGVKEGSVYRTLVDESVGLFEDVCLQDVEGALRRIVRDAAEKLCEGGNLI